MNKNLFYESLPIIIKKPKNINITMSSHSNKIIVVDSNLFSNLKSIGLQEIPVNTQHFKLPRGPRVKYAEYEAKWVPSFNVWICTEEKMVRIGKGNRSIWYNY